MELSKKEIKKIKSIQDWLNKTYCEHKEIVVAKKITRCVVCKKIIRKVPTKAVVAKKKPKKKTLKPWTDEHFNSWLEEKEYLGAWVANPKNGDKYSISLEEYTY